MAQTGNPGGGWGGLISATPDNVARALAPVVHLHSQDLHRPSSVGWYLDRCSLVTGAANIPSDGSFTGSLPSGLTLNLADVTADTLKAASSSTASGYAARTSNYSLWPKTVADGGATVWSLDCPFANYAEQTLFGETIVNNECSSEVYCRIAQHSTGTISITYWFFYPYNGGLGPQASYGSFPLGPRSGFEAHIGDWERVTAFVSISADNEHVTFSGSIVYEAHGGVTFIEPQTELPILVSALSPLVVYSAWHSHASYASVGSHTLESTPLSDDVTDDSGPVWKAADNLVMITGDSPSWVQYNGLWGANINWLYSDSSLGTVYSLTNGPGGPVFHDSWKEDGPQYVPTGGGPLI